MFENIMNFFKKLSKKEKSKESSDTAKERLHLVLMQDRANVSADFLELMRKEIIEVIKKYVDVDEKEIDVHLTNKSNEDGTVGAPALYANIPIVTIKNEARKANVQTIKKDDNYKNAENKKCEESQEKLEENVPENDKCEKIEIGEQANNETTIEENEAEQVYKAIEEKAEQKAEQKSNETAIEESQTEQEIKQNDENEVEETIEKIDKEETTSNQ